MTSDEALDVIADEVICAAVREVIENGLWDSYIDAELSDKSSTALRNRLSTRAAAAPHPAVLLEALKVHAQA